MSNFVKTTIGLAITSLVGVVAGQELVTTETLTGGLVLVPIVVTGIVGLGCGAVVGKTCS